MRRLLTVLGAVPLALLATQASAQTTGAQGTVYIDGFVTSRCAFTLDNAVIHLGELALQTSGANGGKLDTSRVNGKNATLTGWCNGSDADISVEAFPLLNPASISAGFDNRVDYTATASVGSPNPTDTTLSAGGGTPRSVGSLFNGNVVVTMSAAATPNNGVMVAGDYEGQVIVTLTPNVAPQESE